MLGKNIGIDLGTSSVLIYVKGKGITLREPSVVAMEKPTGRIIKMGFEAQEMLGKTPKNIFASRPLKEGVICDYDTTEKMLGQFIKKACTNTLFRPNAVISVPPLINEVEERAVRQAVINAGAKNIELIESPMAAAIGSGIDITRPRGTMVVDIGGGTTDIAVMSLGDGVVSGSVKCGGDKVDEAIVRYIRKEFAVLIGERTAEEIKIKIGCACPRPEKLSLTVKGRSMTTGLPKEVTINSENVMHAIAGAADTVASAIHDILSKTPPELISDISADGIMLAGGASMLYAFDKMLAAKIGIHVFVASDASSCVATGAGIAADMIDNISQIKINLPRKRLWK